jgi:hypothetical protein
MTEKSLTKTSIENHHNTQWPALALLVAVVSLFAVHQQYLEVKSKPVIKVMDSVPKPKSRLKMIARNAASVHLSQVDGASGSKVD